MLNVIRKIKGKRKRNTTKEKQRGARKKVIKKSENRGCSARVAPRVVRCACKGYFFKICKKWTMDTFF